MSIKFVKERLFKANGIQLAAKEWGDPSGMPVIALHGWLDNANSFDQMLPYLTDMHVIAIDMAGHSQSGDRSEDSGYDIWQDIGDVLAVSEQMNWDRFALLGHSRGAIVSALVAGTFPKLVSHCILIDSYFPIPNKPANAAGQLAKAITDRKRFQTIKPSAFNSFDDAVKARVNGFVPLQKQAATILAERGVVEVDGKFSWRNDQRLKSSSMLTFTKEQCESFFTAIKCPIMLIQAESGLLQGPIQPQLKEWVPHIEVLSMAGSHHLHLEDQAQQVAEKTQQLFIG
ncbi:MAG: alpha/beta fold hydrolase [Cellvibrionales bacterium TMED47]|nr:alpha/beta hydrolase [Porticoccaceae bacterium]RPG85019.1 MAG: alpha/beta fold hydrolase [Cellvibrionales bacterium TMED47]